MKTTSKPRKLGRPSMDAAPRIKITIDVSEATYGHLAGLRGQEGRSFGRLVDAAFYVPSKTA